MGFGERSKLTFAVAVLAALVAAGSPGEADVHVPIVGSVAGANESAFRSDLKLYNPTDGALEVTIILTERSASESAEDPRLVVTLPPRQTMAWENIYDAITPGAQGAGKLRITSTGVDPVVSTNTYTKLTRCLAECSCAEKKGKAECTIFPTGIIRTMCDERVTNAKRACDLQCKADEER